MAEFQKCIGVFHFRIHRSMNWFSICGELAEVEVWSNSSLAPGARLH